MKVRPEESIFDFCSGGAPFSTGALWHTSGSGLFSNDDVIGRAIWDNHGSLQISFIIEVLTLSMEIIVILYLVTDMIQNGLLMYLLLWVYITRVVNYLVKNIIT